MKAVVYTTAGQKFTSEDLPKTIEDYVRGMARSLAEGTPDNRPLHIGTTTGYVLIPFRLIAAIEFVDTPSRPLGFLDFKATEESRD